MDFAWMDDTPVGRLLIAADDEGLRYVLFDQKKSRSRHVFPQEDWKQSTRRVKDAISQLKAYFKGQRQHFDLPLAADGTDFQKKVWHELTTIPYGETASYGQIASQIDQPTASRAVGMANGRNPISIIVPCHRIIGSSGKLVGYGGGLERKKALLRLEGVAI
jgi:methylated-DNA-[protein]-cysteine S-methyltransferase